MPSKIPTASLYMQHCFPRLIFKNQLELISNEILYLHVIMKTSFDKSFELQERS